MNGLSDLGAGPKNLGTTSSGNVTPPLGSSSVIRDLASPGPNVTSNFQFQSLLSPTGTFNMGSNLSNNYLNGPGSPGGQ